MKQYEEVFFSVVRHALWKAPLEIPEGFSDWGSVMKLAKSQAMTGLVGDVLLRTPDILETLPPRFVARLQEIPLENMGTHTVLNNTLIMVVTRLREHGIEPVLLKGQGIAQYYPVPQLRQCGDIDLYVGEENYAKAYDVLLPVATEIDDRSEAMDTAKHFHMHIGAVLLEIHKYAHKFTFRKDNKKYEVFAIPGLTQNLVMMDFSGIKVNTPADDFNVFYVFNHLCQHFLSSGVGFRQLCDLACMLHAKREMYSMQNLELQLNSLDLMTPWQLFGCVIVDFLGLPREEFPFYDSKMLKRSGYLVEQILYEGNFGHQTLRTKNAGDSYLMDKTLALKWHTFRILSMMRILPRHMVINFFHMLVDGFRQVFKDLSVRSRR